jgi:GT2 family glycosyltransferase
MDQPDQIMTDEQKISESSRRLSVIIVSYNCRELLLEAIRSVATGTDMEAEVIVVDNASTDGTVQAVTSLFPEVKLIANTYNAGFSKANNQGFALSRGEYILLLNPDAMLIGTGLDRALSFLDEHPRSILGPELLNPDRSLQDSVIPVPGFKAVLTEALFLTYLFRPSLPAVLKKNNYALSGACLLLTRENYALLNGLDEDLFWMDDVDFCFRARRQGLDIIYFSRWQVIHVIGQSGRKNYKVAISNQLISKLKFFKKHGLILDFIVSACFIQLHILLRLLLFLVLSPLKAGARSKFQAYLHTQSLFLKYIFTNQKQTF